jgi:hypothetical protein
VPLPQGICIEVFIWVSKIFLSRHACYIVMCLAIQEFMYLGKCGGYSDAEFWDGLVN